MYLLLLGCEEEAWCGVRSFTKPAPSTPYIDRRFARTDARAAAKDAKESDPALHVGLLKKGGEGEGENQLRPGLGEGLTTSVYSTHR